MQIVSEAICMKCERLFSGKNKKNISKCRLLNFLPKMLSGNFINLRMCGFSFDVLYSLISIRVMFYRL